MTDGNATAHPCIESLNQGDWVEITTSEAGLTKREMFAAMAKVDIEGWPTDTVEKVTGKRYMDWKDNLMYNIQLYHEFEATMKVIAADALIAALNKEKV